MIVHECSSSLNSKPTCKTLDMDGLYIAKIPLKLWLKMNEPEDEIFRKSCKMINDFVSEVKAPPTGKVVDKLINLDEALEDVIELINNFLELSSYEAERGC